MIKVIIDTNVVVSANLVDEGPSAAILLRKTSREVLPNNILKISAHESDNRFYECPEALTFASQPLREESAEISTRIPASVLISRPTSFGKAQRVRDLSFRQAVGRHFIRLRWR